MAGNNWFSKLVFRGLFAIVALWLIPFIANKYPDQSFPFISEADIPEMLVSNINASQAESGLCPQISPYLKGMDYNVHNILESVNEIKGNNLENELKVKLVEGFWQPLSCTSRYQVIIVVPYRERKTHLEIFLHYMHPFLQRQQLSYRIVVVEQDNDKAFNRAKLFNIGYAETAFWRSSYTCYIFHDIDLIPENDHNIYACTKSPRHMISALDSFRYNLLYRNLLGGAVAMLAYQYEEVDGFSNGFDGWGAEDDDFSGRLLRKGLNLVRFDPSVASYSMLRHLKESPSPTRFNTLYEKRYAKNDGISSVKYIINTKEHHPLYTHLMVSWD